MNAGDEAIIRRFARAAEEFCRALESTPPTRRDLAYTLHELCALALQLPDVERTERERERERVSTKELAISFGEHDRYREIFDAYSDEDAVTGSLIDDMRDIHRNLEEGLAIFRGGSEDDLRDAAWTWRFYFHMHWGEHATSALRALYWLIRADS
jgi:hypothetical protein